MPTAAEQSFRRHETGDMHISDTTVPQMAKPGSTTSHITATHTHAAARSTRGKGMPETVMAADTTQCSCVQTGACACAVLLCGTQRDVRAFERLIGVSPGRGCMRTHRCASEWVRAHVVRQLQRLALGPRVRRHHHREPCNSRRARASVSGPCPRPSAAVGPVGFGAWFSGRRHRRTPRRRAPSPLSACALSTGWRQLAPLDPLVPSYWEERWVQPPS